MIILVRAYTYQGWSYRRVSTFFTRKNWQQIFLCSWRDSNYHPLDVESDALPIEPPRPQWSPIPWWSNDVQPATSCTISAPLPVPQPWLSSWTLRGYYTSGDQQTIRPAWCTKSCEDLSTTPSTWPTQCVQPSGRPEVNSTNSSWSIQELMSIFTSSFRLPSDMDDHSTFAPTVAMCNFYPICMTPMLCTPPQLWSYSSICRGFYSNLKKKKQMVRKTQAHSNHCHKGRQITRQTLKFVSFVIICSFQSLSQRNYQNTRTQNKQKLLATCSCGCKHVHTVHEDHIHIACSPNTCTTKEQLFRQQLIFKTVKPWKLSSLFQTLLQPWQWVKGTQLSMNVKSMNMIMRWSSCSV